MSPAVPAETAATAARVLVADSDVAHEDVLSRVGHMTRSLHESLRGLGFDRLVEQASHTIPDARDRLDYVARMTEQAAQRVLNATDAAGPLQERIHDNAAGLSADWQQLLQQPFLEDSARAMAQRTVSCLDQTCADAMETRQHLTSIMMAQDFQDLTGQVIMKVTELVHGLEQQLLQLLVDYTPQDKARDADAGLLNGPQINPRGHGVVASQTQVDDLLESLGF